MLVTKILPTLLFQSIFGNFYDCSFLQIILIHVHVKQKNICIDMDHRKQYWFAFYISIF